MRYAIYHTPDRYDPLAMAASNWLGRSAFGDPANTPVLPENWTAERHSDLVRDAKRYGFHATLKAPFSLAKTVREQDLFDHFAALKLPAADIVIPSLVLRQIDGFFALVAEHPNDILNAFAGVLVREFDKFRAPLTADEIARRHPDSLSDQQRSHLEHWGYPYVFDEFFFHMTLTSRVHGTEAQEVRTILEQHFAAYLGKPYSISHIAIFVEPAPSMDFSIRSIRPVHNSHSNGKA